MKSLILIVIIGLVSCKKQDIKPSPEPVKNQSLYNFRMAGLELIDTAVMKINGVIIEKNLSGYHLQLNKGDTIQLYYTGNGLTKKGSFNFAIWEDKNELPKIQKTESDSINILRKYALGKPVYYKYYFLKTTLILN